MREGWLAAFAPRLWADCNLLITRWVPGESGGWSCRFEGRGSEGIVPEPTELARAGSLVGLGIFSAMFKSRRVIGEGKKCLAVQRWDWDCDRDQLAD